MVYLLNNYSEPPFHLTSNNAAFAVERKSLRRQNVVIYICKNFICKQVIEYTDCVVGGSETRIVVFIRCFFFTIIVTF
jgi:hypothetical protein